MHVQKAQIHARTIDVFFHTNGTEQIFIIRMKTKLRIRHATSCCDHLYRLIRKLVKEFKWFTHFLFYLMYDLRNLCNWYIMIKLLSNPDADIHVYEGVYEKHTCTCTCNYLRSVFITNVCFAAVTSSAVITLWDKDWNNMVTWKRRILSLQYIHLGKRLKHIFFQLSVDVICHFFGSIWGISLFLLPCVLRRDIFKYISWVFICRQIVHLHGVYGNAFVYITSIYQFFLVGLVNIHYFRLTTLEDIS